MRLFLLTSLTMIAFAGNSVLGRLALADGSMDAASYSFLRVVSAVVLLLALVKLRYPARFSNIKRESNWAAALALFGYVAGFSYAYQALDTGMGALILFSCVQAMMIGWGLYKGDRPGVLEWLGIAMAFGAFVFLMSPGLTAPPLVASVIMGLAGVAWGVYSLLGKRATNPLLATTGNFTRVVPMVIALSLISVLVVDTFTVTPFGVTMAVLSGAVTSALGYALWYQVLPLLTATRAAIVQLTVPVLATFGGIVFAGEGLTLRFALCSAFILLGIALSVLAKSKRS
ncbi:MAG: DMT family transporter [Pseudomonadota bacterium]